MPPMAQYHASKLAAYKAILDFYDANPNLHFEIATIHPAYVFGRSLVQEIAQDLAGTNKLLFSSLMSEKPAFGRFVGVHVDDVAETHVKALTHVITAGAGAVTGVQSYLLAARGRSWQEVYDFVKSRYPDLAIGLMPEDSPYFNVDASKATRELGIHFKDMEKQVGDMLDQQLELRAKE
jgi:nucleoside-diphosphate-sugar epimerase